MFKTTPHELSSGSKPMSLLRKAVNNEIAVGYSLLAPALIGIIIFVIIPMIYAFWVSLHQWDALIPMKWVGMQNYRLLFRDHDWLISLGKTFLYMIVFVPCLYTLSLILALIVKYIRGSSGVFRTIFFFPVIMSPAICGLIWKFIYSDKGVFNHLLAVFDIGAVRWLSSVEVSIYSVIIVSLWLQMGFYMIIFLAGLQDIPKDYYEAATIDGANSWQSFWKITLPNLKHTSVFIIIVSIIGSFQVFDQIKLMTAGGPANSTRLAVLYIFEQSFKLYNMGYASALSFNLFVIILVFTLLQMKFMKINNE
jgi:multiple sugar transport system permease protein